jgi:hypothetical protein
MVPELTLQDEPGAAQPMLDPSLKAACYPVRGTRRPPRFLSGLGVCAGLCGLLLAGCGPSGSPASQNVEGDTATSLASDAGETSPVGRSGITAVDAALGDGAGLPADSRAPTAYDRAQAGAGQTESRRNQPADDADSGANGTPGASAVADAASTQNVTGNATGP